MPSNFFFNFKNVCVSMCTCVRVYTTTLLWRSEEYSGESRLFSLHVGPGIELGHQA